MSRMRVLLFSPRACSPPDTGAKLREYHLVRELSRSMDVDLLAFATTTGLDLPFCRKVKTVPRPERYTAGKLLKGIVSGTPVSVWNYYSEAMVAALRGMLEQQRYDAIVLESIHMAGYRQELKQWGAGALLVYDWHNVESELMYRYAGQTNHIGRKLYARHTAWQLRRLEREILTGDDGHIVCSDREENWVRGHAPRARVSVVRNGVDTTVYKAAARPGPDRRRILFVGSMDYRPNMEAVKYFSGRVWPALRALRPELVFTVVGSNPGPQVRELAQQAGIEVTGTVPRVEPFYEEAAAVVVPLFEGGGTRLKIVEAMAAGVPVFSTRLGAEGIAATDGEDILFVEANEDWVEPIARLLDEPERWIRVGTAGRKLARDQYDWESIGSHFARLLANWIADRRETNARG